MTRWSAFADSTPTWAAVRRLVHPDVLNAPPARPTPGVAAATANAISPTATPARTALATLLFTEDPLLHASPPPCACGISLSTPHTVARAEPTRNARSRIFTAGPARLSRRRQRLHWARSGRVAQRESTRFTREGSLVRSQPRPLQERRGKAATSATSPTA